MDSILIIDHEKDNIDALHRLLRNDYEITSATSPFDALKLIQNQEFAVIVSDQRMPKMTGVDLLEKARHVSPASTRILLTGYTDIDAVIEAINRGHVYRYIAKPWEPDELKVILKQACEAYHLRVELDQKNRALQKSNDELKNALEQLQVLDRAKARFLSLVSHELNTPLTVLNSFIELLRSSKDGLPDDLRSSISSLGKASDRLTEIVTDVLMYVKIEATTEYQQQPVDLVQLTQSISSELSSVLKEKQVQFDLNVPEKAPINADVEKLKIALKALLTDCVGRSPANERIRIKIDDADDSWNYSVLAQGETLSEKALQPLETGADEMHHTQRLGLALAICKTVVDAHGGSAHLTPTGDQGNLVRLVLPK